MIGRGKRVMEWRRKEKFSELSTRSVQNLFDCGPHGSTESIP